MRVVIWEEKKPITRKQNDGVDGDQNDYFMNTFGKPNGCVQNRTRYQVDTNMFPLNRRRLKVIINNYHFVV